MRLWQTIGLLSTAAVVAAAGVLTACSSSSSGTPSPGNDAGTTPDAGGTPDSGGTTEGGGGLTCAAYCNTIMANCTGANQQYLDVATCNAMCAKLDVGTTADMSGDTLGCRTYHAGAASMNATLHCPHAGPTGAGVCSTSVCDSFCKLDLAQCTGTMAAYPDKTTCVSDCNAYATVDAGEIAAVSGNTLNCRLYHLQAAYGMPATHCPHTGPSTDAGSAGPCN